MRSTLSSALLLCSVLLSPVQANIALQGKDLEKTYEPASETAGMNPWARGLLFGCLGFVGGFGGYIITKKATRKRRRRKYIPRTAVVLAGCLGGLFLPGKAAACLNIGHHTLEETYIPARDYRNYTDKAWLTGTVRNALDAKPADDPHLKPDAVAYPAPPPPGVLDSDEAARMILRGDAAGALAKLKDIETAHPGLYIVAANMGTAYELTGDDANALKWINEGIRRNPSSHMLAEWLHVKILEAKIALKDDPNWFRKHTITGFDPRQLEFLTSQGTKDGMGILKSVRSQATVRALFIKPRDVIMSRLLLEAAGFALTADPGSTLGLLDLAVEYGLPREATQAVRAAYEEQREEALRLAGPSGTRARILDHLHWLVFGLAGAGGILVARKRLLRRI